MKILAFTDTHADIEDLEKIKSKALKEKPDIIVCCGDISVFGNGLNFALSFINDLKIKTLIVKGNHETSKALEDACSRFKNIINISNAGTFELDNYLFFGYGNNGFSHVDEKFERLSSKFIKTFDRSKKLIFITHAPIYNTKLDKLPVGHCGSLSSRKFVEKVYPVLTLCGHFHETFKVKDKIKNCLIINPGPDGMIIEI